MLTTQVMSEAEELCDEILIMHKGRAIAQGDLKSLKLLSRQVYDVDRDNGIFYEMLTYPLSRAEFLAGKVAFNVLLAVLQATVTVGLAAAILGVKLKPTLLPLLFVGVVLGTAG